MTLRTGSSGSEVRALQTRLEELGFSPGPIDGQFGPGTESAVRAFQQGRELAADGVVGPPTAEALGLELDRPEAEVEAEISSGCWISTGEKEAVAVDRRLLWTFAAGAHFVASR